MSEPFDFSKVQDTEEMKLLKEVLAQYAHQEAAKIEALLRQHHMVWIGRAPLVPWEEHQNVRS